MPTISILGAGSMGKAVGGIARRAGAEVQILARMPDDASAAAQAIGATAGVVGDPLTGDVVVLAVPYSAVAELLARYGADLADKTIVDVTNPVDYSTFDDLAVPSDSSVAQQVASSVPHARVLKAFNTTFAGTLNSGRTGDCATTVLIAGDDQPAKEALADLVTRGGLKAMDVGSLKRARELEAIGFLQSTLAASGMISWSGGFAVAE